MVKKTRKKFTEEEKRQAVADYVSEARTAQQIAIGPDIQVISRWQTFYDEQKIRAKAFRASIGRLIGRIRRESHPNSR